MTEKNNLDKYTGILFELKIGLNKNNAIVIDYGGKPVGKIREALKDIHIMVIYVLLLLIMLIVQVKNYKMILNNLYKKFRYYFWHNFIMDKLEGYASKLSNWFWQKRWSDRNLYRYDQKKRPPD